MLQDIKAVPFPKGQLFFFLRYLSIWYMNILEGFYRYTLSCHLPFSLGDFLREAFPKYRTICQESFEVKIIRLSVCICLWGSWSLLWIIVSLTVAISLNYRGIRWVYICHQHCNPCEQSPNVPYVLKPNSIAACTSGPNPGSYCFLPQPLFTWHMPYLAQRCC